MARRNDIDWEAIETEYRINRLSVRQIATKYGTQASTITRKAEKDGWVKDLSEAVKVATKAKVRAEVSKATQQNATECNTSVALQVEVAATIGATVTLRQQSRTTRLAALLESMTGELEQVSADPLVLDNIAQAIEEEDPKAAEAIKKLRSVTTRMNNLKTASEVLARVNQEERKTFGLDEDGKGGTDSIEDTIRKIKEEEGLA